MERFSTEEVKGTSSASQDDLPNGFLQFNPKRDLPMILAVRNATFISHGQLYAHLVSQGTESNRQGFCWRLKRLADAGVIQKMAQVVPFSGATYAITREGLSCLESCGEGLISLTSESKSLPNFRQAAHYLELGEIRNALRRARILKRWIADVELKSMNLAIDQPLAKDYDAVADLALEGGSTVVVGIEYERTLKSSQRYSEIVNAIKEERQIDLLIYLTASMDLVYQLKAKFEDLDFPTVIAPSGAFCRNPLELPMHSTILPGPQKATLSELVSAIEAGRRS